MKNRFQILAQSGKARSGSFASDHGTFATPNFMPVGTRASVKGVDVERLKEAGAQITLVNTYHLWQRPGDELVKELGGIHKFCAWDGPILSDSGGFQIFSLQAIRKLKEEGVSFRSHIDGSPLFLSPEKSIEIQENLGVDIAMVLDECPSAELDFNAVEKSLGLTLRWARRCIEAHKREGTSLFGITQGGVFPKLRARAAEAIGEMPFDGVAIGGLSVGEPIPKMYEVLSYHVDQLPADRIHYLMGVGTPRDIVEAVSQGVDLFDCVMPTRAGRFGRAYINGEAPYLNIKNSEHRESELALDENCDCLACRRYSRAYIHHLFRVQEMLGPQLLSIHNLTHYLDLMQRIRVAIEADAFPLLYADTVNRWKDISSAGDLSQERLD